MLSHAERRRAPRFELHLPVTIRWRDGSETREAVTVCKDVSSNGIYFDLREGIKEGTPVEVEMTLPNQITLAGPVRVRCFGRIQRCEMTGETRGRGCGYRKIRIVAEHPTSARERQACLNEEALRSLLRKIRRGNAPAATQRHQITAREGVISDAIRTGNSQV